MNSFFTSAITQVDANKLHQKALSQASDFRKSESLLLETLMEIDAHKVFISIGYPNLHTYCTRALSLTDAQAYAFCGVARKSREVPELKESIDLGKVHLSNARRIVPFLNQENKSEWIEKAATLSQRELEREIRVLHPELPVKERIRAVSETRSELKLSISVELEKQLKQVKDLLSQSKQRDVSLEEALLELTKMFIERKDPVVKAQRVAEKKDKAQAKHFVAPAKDKISQIAKATDKACAVMAINPGFNLCPRPNLRERFTANELQSVHLRDQRQCCYVYPNGTRCTERRWLQVHHKKAVALGGSNHIDNLITLCQGHHTVAHANSVSEWHP